MSSSLLEEKKTLNESLIFFYSIVVVVVVVVFLISYTWLSIKFEFNIDYVRYTLTNIAWYQLEIQCITIWVFVCKKPYKFIWLIVIEPTVWKSNHFQSARTYIWKKRRKLCQQLQAVLTMELLWYERGDHWFFLLPLFFSSNEFREQLRWITSIQ